MRVLCMILFIGVSVNDNTNIQYIHSERKNTIKFKHND